MEFQTSLYVAPLFVATFIAIVLFIYAWRRRGTIGATPFAWTMFGMAFWAAVNALQWASADIASQVFWAKMRLFGTELLTVSFFIFSMQYTRQTKELKKWIKWLIYLPPGLTFIMVWTNEYHSWFWKEIVPIQFEGFTGIDFEFGPWFWAHTGYDYSLLSISVIQFTLAFFRSRHIYRGQLGAVILGTTIPWVANMAYIFGISPVDHLDLTPFGFILGGIILTGGFYRYQMLDVVSISRDVIIQNMVTAVLITDNKGRIIDVNPSAENLLGVPGSIVIGRSFAKVLDQWTLERGAFKRVPRGESEEVTVKIGNSIRYYDLRKSPLQDVDGSITGHLYQMRDITEIKQGEVQKKNYYTFLDQLEEPYFEADLKGNVVYANPALSNRTRFSAEEIIGKSFRRIIHTDQVRKIYEIFNQVYRTGESVSGVEYNYLTKDGGVRYGEGSVSLMTDENDEPVGFRGLIVDVTERRKAEMEVLQAKEIAEARAAELATINQVADQVSSTLNMYEMLYAISREMVKIFNARNAGIALMNETKTGVRIEAFYSDDPNESDATGTELPLKGNPATVRVLETKKTVVIQDAQTDPLTESIHELMKERGTKSLMIVPLLARGEVIGTIGMPSKDPDRIYTKDEVDLAETIASQVASAVENARLHEKTEEALHVVEQDLEIGREIQSGFMPAVMPKTEGWEVAASFQPARQVGGDFFDAFELPDGKIGVVMADVCDKGVGAALFMVVFRSLLRALTERIGAEEDVQASMKDIILSVNNYIAGTHSPSNMFATMFFGILDPVKNTLFYINGGHEPPLIVDKKGKVRDQLMPTGPAVGLLPDLEFKVEEFKFNVDDTLICFTDGTTDAQNAKGEFFTEERLLEAVANPGPSAFSLLKHVESLLDNHIANTKQFDDITLLVLRRRDGKEGERHKIALPARIENLTKFKDFVEQASQAAGSGKEITFSLVLSVDEAVTNIIMHGDEHTDPSPIELEFEQNNGEVKLVIIDHGTAFNPEDAPEPDLDSEWDERAIGGLGLFLIQEMMDEVHYKSTKRNGNQLTLVKRLEPK